MLPRTLIGLLCGISGLAAQAPPSPHLVMSYSTSDGSAIAGAIGFAMKQGAVRAQLPTVQRLDRGQLFGNSFSGGLDFTKHEQRPLEELQRRVVQGISPHASGTFVIWIGGEADRTPFRVQQTLYGFEGQLLNPRDYPHRWIIAVPEGAVAEVRKRCAKQLVKVAKGNYEVIAHHGAEALARTDWVLFLDDRLALRSSQEIIGRRLPNQVEQWGRFFRSRR